MQIGLTKSHALLLQLGPLATWSSFYSLLIGGPVAHLLTGHFHLPSH